MASQGQLAMQMVGAIDFIVFFPQICNLFVKNVNLTFVSDEPQKKNDQFVIAIYHDDMVMIGFML